MQQPTIQKVQRVTQGKGGLDLFNSLELLLFGGIALFGLLYGRKLYNHFSNGGSVASLIPGYDGKNDEKAIAQKVSGSKDNISDAEAAMRAKRLYKAMESTGTDEQTIFDVLDKSLTANDVVKIYNAFGYRRYWLGSRAMFMGSEQDLIEWLRAELNKSEFSKVKPLFIKAKLIKE